MKLRLFNIDFYFSFYWYIFLAIIFLTDKTGFAYMVFLAAFLHEGGHLITMCLLNCKPKSVRFNLGAVNIVKNVTASYFHDFLIAAFGPIVNLIVFLLFYILYYCFKNLFFLNFAAINLLLGLFNLLPAQNLDGGDILQYFLNKFLPFNISEAILKFITVILAVALIFIGCIEYTKNKSQGIIIVGLYLLLFSFLSKKQKQK